MLLYLQALHFSFGYGFALTIKQIKSFSERRRTSINKCFSRNTEGPSHQSREKILQFCKEVDCFQSQHDGTNSHTLGIVFK